MSECLHLLYRNIAESLLSCRRFCHLTFPFAPSPPPLWNIFVALFECVAVLAQYQFFCHT